MYAIGEILLVMIGILMALQVNTWNEERKERNRELDYLIGLKNDLESSQSELNRVIEKTDRVRNITTSLLEYKEENNIPEEVLDSMIFRADGYTIFIPAEGTINDLISSGNLNIITEEKIRTTIASWDAEFMRIREREQLGKYEVQQLIDLLRHVAEKYNYQKYSTPLFSDTQRALVLEDPVYRNTFYGIRRNARILHQLYLDKKEFILDFIDLISEEIDRLQD